MILLDGKKLSVKIKNELKEEIGKLNIKPKLVCVLVGNNDASGIYVKNKVTACNYVGINSEVIKLSENTTQKELLAIVNKLASDKTVNGILLQLPLPRHIDSNVILNSIPPLKDVDGLTNENLGKLVSQDQTALVSCTAQGVLALIKEYNLPLEKKDVVILGRSLLVGKPLFHLLTNENATVTLCHSKTKDVTAYTKKADIIVSATGNKNLINKHNIKPKSVIIDVAIIKDGDRICGDVNFEDVKNKVSHISPVPGGVGPLTVTFLLKNTLKAYNLQSTNT